MQYLPWYQGRIFCGAGGRTSVFMLGEAGRIAGCGRSEGEWGWMAGGPVKPRSGASLRDWLAEDLGPQRKLVARGSYGGAVWCGNRVLGERNEQLVKSRMWGRQAETCRCRRLRGSSATRAPLLSHATFPQARSDFSAHNSLRGPQLQPPGPSPGSGPHQRR